MISIVRLTPSASNHDPVLIIDAARRRLNYLAPRGFAAMSGQTDDRLREQGYLEFKLPSSLVPRFRSSVEELVPGDIIIEVRQAG